MGCEYERGEERMTELKSEATNTNINERDEIHEYITKRLANKSDLSYTPKVIEKKPQKEKIQPIEVKGKPKDDFSRYLLGLFNSLRLNPSSYIDTILRAKKNIQNKYGGKIYKSSVKVALNSGEKAFDSAIEVLKKTEKMSKLFFKPELVIDLPTTENDIKNKGYLPNQIKKKMHEGFEIKSYWKDVVKDPDTCFILTIVDDTGRNAGNKRADILDRNNKYIGISSVKIGESFACYIVLS